MSKKNKNQSEKPEMNKNQKVEISKRVKGTSLERIEAKAISRTLKAFEKQNPKDSITPPKPELRMAQRAMGANIRRFHGTRASLAWLPIRFRNSSSSCTSKYGYLMPARIRNQSKLREAAVVENGEKLGPLGAKIVADTFISMLKSDPNSYLNKSGGFTPFLNYSIPNPSSPSNPIIKTVKGVEDIIMFTGVNLP